MKSFRFNVLKTKLNQSVQLVEPGTNQFAGWFDPGYAAVGLVNFHFLHLFF